MKSVSIITPTYNSYRTINACIKSLKIQDYPKNLIEHIIVDGGSTDGTLDVLENTDAHIIYDKTGSPESAKANGLKTVNGDYILFLPSDNILPHSKWLRKMITALEKSADAIAAYPRNYGWRKNDLSLTRYFALLGANDPVAWFLGKADRNSYINSVASGKSEIVTFTEENMPTLGDNGFLIKKTFLNKAQIDPRHFYHIDVCLDLVKQGFNKFIVVNDVIVHDTGGSFKNFLCKRYRYMKQLYLTEHDHRRYKVFDASVDTHRLLMYCAYSVSVIGPITHAIRGFLKKPDFAWFYHPFVCLGLLIIYAAAVIDDKLSPA